MFKNEFIYTINDLIYSIRFKSKIILIDTIKRVEELKYFINWLKENFVVINIEDNKSNKIDIESLKDEDLFNEKSYCQLDTNIFIHKNPTNSFITLEIFFKQELECFDDDGLIIGSFDEIFEESMFVEKRKNIKNELVDYIIKNIYGTCKAITVNNEEECKDFIEFLYNNFYINDIMLSEKNANPIDNRKTMVKDFITYCKYKDYKIVIELDGGEDINVWGLISNLDDISEEMEIIEWVKLKEICKETDEIK